MQLSQMTRGDTPEWDLVVLQSDGATPFNLAGFTLWFTAKRSIDDSDADAVFQLSTTGGEITITDAAAGEATIRPLRGSTDTLTDEPVLVWDVQLSLTGTPDQTYTVARGTLRVIKDVTRQP